MVTCPYVIMHVRSASLYMALIPKSWGSGHNSKNKYAYRTCKLRHSSCHWW